jgi:nicotinamidase-related amidase
MPAKKAATALIVLDMLSEFDFHAGPAWQRAALKAARPLSALLQRARKRAPVIYVNDTRGFWESDQRAFIRRCLAGAGAKVAELVMPEPSDYFVFKPRHSAFYGTPLAELLYMLKVQHLVLSGISSHQCVLLTASDAHLRNLDVTIAVDCIAAQQPDATRHALYVMEHGLHARLRRSSTIRFP